MPQIMTEYQPGQVTASGPAGVGGGGGGFDLSGVGGLLSQVAARRAWEREQERRAAEEERKARMALAEREQGMREQEAARQAAAAKAAAQPAEPRAIARPSAPVTQQKMDMQGRWFDYVDRQAASMFNTGTSVAGKFAGSGGGAGMGWHTDYTPTNMQMAFRPALGAGAEAVDDNILGAGAEAVDDNIANRDF